MKTLIKIGIVVFNYLMRCAFLSSVIEKEKQNL